MMLVANSKYYFQSNKTAPANMIKQPFPNQGSKKLKRSKTFLIFKSATTNMAMKTIR